MKLFLIGLVSIAIFALCQAVPTGGRGRRFRQKFTKANAGTSGRGEGDETSVDTESNVQAGGEDTGAIAETRGSGFARGLGKSTLDIESWAGFEGFQTGAAGGGGVAEGDETNVETDSDVFIGEDSGFANSATRIGARGRGRQSAFDFESFSELAGFSSGVAGGGGRANGQESEIKGESSVKSEFGKGTLSTSGSEGAAVNNDGLAVVDLSNFAAVEETNTEGKSEVKAIGNDARGSSGSSSFHGPDGEIQIGSESEGEARARGRGGIRTRAEAIDDIFSIEAGSEGRGEGDNVYTSGSSKTGLTNTNSAGKSQSAARASGRGSSFAESAATLVIGEEKPEAQDAVVVDQDTVPVVVCNVDC